MRIADGLGNRYINGEGLSLVICFTRYERSSFLVFSFKVTTQNQLRPSLHTVMFKGFMFYNSVIKYLEHAVAQLFEALCYKPEGRGFDSRWCHWDFSFT